jgi:hypothetical protein
MQKSSFIYVFGVTCTGKDYLVEKALQMYPNIFGAVQVGKEFRRRYPPEHFQGMGAPAHTEDEAYQIFLDELNKVSDKNRVLIVGQPRRASHVDRIYRKYPGLILWLHAKDVVLEERINKRFPDDLKSKELAIQRLANDRIQLYDTLYELSKYHADICCFESGVDSVIDCISQLAQTGTYYV